MRLTAQDIADLASVYFREFLPFFSNQREGSIDADVRFIASAKMKRRIGLSYLFDNIVRLNESYFQTNPSALPYTIFHEMTHLWLYHCHLDPGHTWRFYEKMKQFDETGYLIDNNVFVHTRIQSEAKFVYWCHNCGNRWFVREQSDREIYCGQCFRIDGKEYYPQLYTVETSSTHFLKVIRSCLKP